MVFYIYIIKYEIICFIYWCKEICDVGFKEFLSVVYVDVEDFKGRSDVLNLVKGNECKFVFLI